MGLGKKLLRVSKFADSETQDLRGKFIFGRKRSSLWVGSFVFRSVRRKDFACTEAKLSA